MISLASDSIALASEYLRPMEALSAAQSHFVTFRPETAVSVPQFCFFTFVAAGRVYSRWERLESGSQRILASADAMTEARHQFWDSIDHRTRSEYFRAKKGEPSRYPLTAEVFAKTQSIYARMLNTQRSLTEALMDLAGADEFCELWPKGGASAFGLRYVYRKATLWSSRRTLTPAEWIALIDRALANDKAARAAITQTPPSNATTGRFIPIEVRHEVWRRDQGKCATCGKQERLEFDHIIPVALGGGNTARNIQLLCEACNRAKGATLG